MKTSYNKPRKYSQAGIVLLMTMIFVVLAAVTLTSYIVIVEQERAQVDRSQNWNSALALAEAGVDEALAQMNASPGSFSANNWGGGTGTNGTFGPVTRTLAGGSYSVSIVNGSVPTIYATGFVAVAQISQKVSRKVKVTTSVQPESAFSVGLGAVNNITMNGNSLLVDSYNSTTNTLSTGGQYDSSKISTNGNVASVDGILDIGNQTILV